MRGNLTAIFILIVAAVSYGLYQLSYEVQELEKNLASVNSRINDNRETIRILKAEWSYQNRPENLQSLASRYLPLLLVAPYQVTKVAYLPEFSDDAVASGLIVIPRPRVKPRDIPFVPSQPLVLATYKLSSGEGTQQ